MTTLASLTVSILAAAVPGLFVRANDPGTILGFAVVAACLFFAIRDYGPRPAGRHR